MLSLNTTQGPCVTGCTRSENSTARCCGAGEKEGKSNAERRNSFVHLSLFFFLFFFPFSFLFAYTFLFRHRFVNSKCLGHHQPLLKVIRKLSSCEVFFFFFNSLKKCTHSPVHHRECKSYVRYHESTTRVRSPLSN